MCTLTIISLPSGYRVVCNRDESRGRADAAAPRWHTLPASHARALWPTDTQAGGTWIASAAHGLTLSLLNLNLDDPPDLSRVPGLLSRGLVIPSLIALPDAHSAAHALARLTLSRFAPFRLVAIDPGALGSSPRIIEARWDRLALSIAEHAGAPACFASSGLGDSFVQCRAALFEETVIRAGATAESQDRFHAHRWEDRPELSVLMSRDEARTVSVTTVEVDAPAPAAAPPPVPRVRMNYAPVRERVAVPASA